MNRLLPAIILISILSCAVQGAYALGEIRACNFGSAIPSTWLRAYYGSATRMESVISSLPELEKRPDSDIYGGAFGIKVLPRLELGGWVYSHAYNTTFELQAKCLLMNNGSSYISVAPGLVSSAGDKKFSSYSTSYDNLETSCQARGFGLPVIYTLDTKRNLLVNVMAGLNWIWVKNEGQFTDYNSETHQYDTTEYEYSEGPLPSGRISASLDANNAVFSLIPEIGVTFINVRDEGIKQVANYGFSLGFRW